MCEYGLLADEMIKERDERIVELQKEKDLMQTAFMREIAELRERCDMYRALYHTYSKAFCFLQSALVKVAKNLALNTVMGLTHSERNEEIRSEIRDIMHQASLSAEQIEKRTSSRDDIPF